MKIFLGLTDIANVTENFAKGFRALGHEVFTCVWNRSYFYPDTNYDLVIDKRPAGKSSKPSLITLLGMTTRLLELFKKKNSCDLYILYSPAVLPLGPFLKLLRRQNKKIVCIFWGSDIRYWYALQEEMQQLGIDKEMEPFFEFAKQRVGGSYFDKLNTVRAAEKYADLILSQPEYSQLLRRPHNRATIPLDLDAFKPVTEERGKPLILHAPSVPEAKGTDRILKAIKSLKSEGIEFDFQKVEKMPNSKLRNLLNEADILVDQLYSTTIASVASEAMASGCAVLARYLPDYSKVEMPCPVVNTNIFTFKDDLRALILDKGRRQELSEAGPNYVRRVNDCTKVAARILEALEKPEDQEYDFYPTFNKTFAMPKELLDEEKRTANQKRANFFKILLSTGTTKKQS